MNRWWTVTETWIPKRVLGWLLIIGVAGVSAGLTATADDGLVERASAIQRRAVDFFHDQVAVNGGYVYQVSSDLKWREGEGDAGQTSVWVQPPGTPAVGLAYIEAYRRTGEKFLLDAARDTATCLVKGQLHSGGWQNHIDFDSPLREKLAYRIDGPPRKKARNWSSFDDNQTQAVLKFLMTLDQTLELQDTQLHEVVQTALAGVLRNQFPNGAWAQGFEELDPTQNFPIQAARYPADWPRKHPGGDYWRFYTLNDHALVRVLETMWLAGEIYGDERYRGSALRAADFLIQAQMPEPQPAWAQQYNYQMEPVWARKFEPPAVSGGESQQVIEALMQVATWTGDPKYLKPLGPALDYLERSQLPSGRMARFYELKTNRPLYFNRQYELTYDDSDLPTHYGFITPSNLKRLRQRYNQLQALNSQQLIELGQRQRKTTQVPSDKKIAEIIAAIDERGAWVERGKMRSIKAVTGEIDVISSATFIENLDQLSRYLAGKRPRP